MERHIILAAKFKLEGEACKLRGNWYAAVGWACRIAPSSGLRPPSPPQGKRHARASEHKTTLAPLCPLGVAWPPSLLVPNTGGRVGAVFNLPKFTVDISEIGIQGVNRICLVGGQLQFSRC